MNKNVLVFFTEKGLPITNLKPSIKIRDSNTNKLIIDNGVMEEIGDGFYKYVFSEPKNTKEYIIVCDAGNKVNQESRFILLKKRDLFDIEKEMSSFKKKLNSLKENLDTLEKDMDIKNKNMSSFLDHLSEKIIKLKNIPDQNKVLLARINSLEDNLTDINNKSSGDLINIDVSLKENIQDIKNDLIEYKSLVNKKIESLFDISNKFNDIKFSTLNMNNREQNDSLKKELLDLSEKLRNMKNLTKKKEVYDSLKNQYNYLKVNENE